MIGGKSLNLGQCEQWRIWHQYGECLDHLVGLRAQLVELLPHMEKERPVDDHRELCPAPRITMEANVWFLVQLDFSLQVSECTWHCSQTLPDSFRKRDSMQTQVPLCLQF